MGCHWHHWDVTGVTGTSLVMAQEHAEDIAGLEMSPN